ncbi:head GIN domain-containing protein [Mangrovimonas sp. TPBH4]|uniref:head GIN domain-containing protein n=1 Tax=Mangrovimonas sp. TPBH4 TaxID=1645914 RepID=UPI0006B44822|nr:head GIN domain-containing protein [Mangrovimonas sp. TPBH4]
MKRLVICLFAVLAIGTTQAQKKVKGNGNVTTITRTTSDYNTISCAGSFDYVLVKGTEGQITLEGEANLLEYIITEVKNERLIIKVENSVNLRSGKPIKITIPFTDIEKVSFAGSGELWSEDTIVSNNFDVEMAGSGDLKLSVEANTVEASLAGSGDLDLSGSTTSFEASVAGSGDLDAYKLISNNTDVSVAGSGGAKVYSKDVLKARVAGSGSVSYKGNPTKEDTKVSGSGRIRNN